MERAPDIAALVAAERRESANVLEELTPAQRDAPSLCAGRRVREVVAHMSMGFRYPTARVLLEPVRARGSPSRMTDRLAHRDAAAHQDRPGHHRRPGPGPAGPSTAAPHGRLQGEEAHRFVTA
ncbi:maleylpyruvate isomerase N-terminal domain-containing protein [Streptomyces murinus]|uniref:maleylpyruvate isomerase N-terminal domain-containing protein n=1 Tax=Streptomyces murinus TaxID=33900 RepID=UPI000A3BDC0E|nr:maleylpyruvate isomerase N-terminal domain-containing protein [Streptomyces murinus]